MLLFMSYLYLNCREPQENGKYTAAKTANRIDRSQNVNLPQPQASMRQKYL